MQDEQDGCADLGRLVEPVEVDEVTVRGGDPLSPQEHAAPAQERAPHGLEVPVAAPPGRAELARRYSCP